MIDLPSLAPYLYPLALLVIVLIIIGLLLAPAWEHMKWERRQRRRRF
jgi:hypothetical protein